MKKEQASPNRDRKAKEKAQIDRVVKRIVGDNPQNVSRWREHLAYAAAFCMGFCYGLRESLAGIPDRMKKVWQDSKEKWRR